MRVFQINIFGNLSTGRIMTGIYKELQREGEECIVAFARNDIEEGITHFRIGNKWSVIRDVVYTRFTDRAGFCSKKQTKQLVKKILEFNPDIIHLHNIHGYYLNIGVLFSFLRRYNKPVVWTFHDCWPITGHCCHFSKIKCDRWKKGCHDCPQRKTYPSSYVDSSRKNYLSKKKLFNSLDKLYIVTVSKWLQSVVSESFLAQKNIRTIYNGVDLNMFRPTSSAFRKRYRLNDKRIILGVASSWTENKGLNDFIELNKLIDKNHIIVLVGLTKRQLRRIPSGIIALQRTDSVKELAGLYTTADVFFNASTEETFGMPTLEAMSCGTPTVVYNSTALPEICDHACGMVVEPNDVQEVWNSILKIEELSIDSSTIINKAKQYNQIIQYKKYIDLYKEISQR